MRAYLDPDEPVRLEARPHTAALARPLGRSLALGLGGGLLVVLGSPLAWGLGAAGALALAVAAVRALFAVLRWDRTELLVTSDRLVVVHGLAQRRAATVHLGRAGPIEVEQSALGRALGYGTLIAGDLEIPFVADPGRVSRLAG